MKADNTLYHSRITEALRFNTTIAELDLGIISNESLEYLIKFLKENSTLNHLFIEEGEYLCHCYCNLFY